MRLAFIDHYDSFSFNVIEWLTAGQAGLELVYATCDDAAALARLAADPCPLVLSPGPRRPQDYPKTLELTRLLLGQVPILGICLGHQILAHLAGAVVRRSAAAFHGTTRQITVREPAGILAYSEPQFAAAVYHSLVVDPATLPRPWRILAHDELGETQAIAWTEPGRAPAFGVQFHPESFMSEGAGPIRRAWLDFVR